MIETAPPERALDIIETLGVPVRYLTDGPGPEHFMERKTALAVSV